MVCKTGGLLAPYVFSIGEKLVGNAGLAHHVVAVAVAYDLNFSFQVQGAEAFDLSVVAGQHVIGIKADDAVLAAVKRSIDASNARRVRTIEVFDVEVMGLLARADLPVAAAPLHSESPGSIVDRIGVLALKLYHIRAELSTAGGTADEAALHGRLESIGEQMQDLSGCLDRLFREIAAGERRIKLYRQVKVYRDPATGRYRSGLDDVGDR